ncbi:hypothetical protein [Pediococcus ethanolidurans]|uniref:hypothetical protein n=1 Tax=Pediococcus ethanolidurans TaxID=319653 RepID=UPI0021E95ACB|nr:hypothetical protein [Pediococcus ethanolidurans]MCV3327634.1 hypothetical protein [Pediococcus ethanolidurans]
MKNASTNKNKVIMLNVLSVLLVILSFIHHIPYGSYLLIVASILAMFAYHQEKNILSIVLLIVAFIALLFVLIYGFANLFVYLQAIN